MSEQSPRRPTNLPTGASSLSDRIAALQRKSSTNTGVSRRSASATTSGGNSVDDAINNGVTTTSRSTSSGSQAVKDRIARFQVNEKPLIPKSSFGAPTPMSTGRQSNALRPYPGANASGSGSGQWGENILRPQMTGGTWTGGGDGKESPCLRPQMTGTPWLGVGGSKSSSLNNSLHLKGTHSPSEVLSRSPIRHRDAFLDLEEDKSAEGLTPPRSIPLRRGSSFSEAQMAAASKGLANSSRRSSAEDSEKDFKSKSPISQQVIGASELPILPDTPTKMGGLSLRVPNAASGMISSAADSMLLPTPPTTLPIAIASSPPRDVRTTGDVEIGIGGASPAKIAQLRRSLSGSNETPEPSTSSIRAAGVIPSAPAPFLQELISGRRDDPPAVADKEESKFAQMTVSSPNVKEELIEKVKDDIIDDTDMTKKEEMKRKNEENSSADAAQRIEQACENSESKGETLAGGLVSSAAASSNSQDSNINPISLKDETSTGIPQGRIWNGRTSDSNGTSTSSAAAKSSTQPDEAAPLLDSSSLATQATAAAAKIEEERRAKEVVSHARNTHERIRKPPLGRPMTIAEMDASDDEYEPGWASVISATSSRT